jgi:ATP-binding cassette subfamily B protein
MLRIKELLGLSDEGYSGLKRGILAVVLTNLTMFISFGVIVYAITAMLSPLIDGGSLSIGRLWLLLLAGIAAAVLYYFAYRSEYRKTYTVSYKESERIRLEVAERIRRLPLSFFNNKDLAELTTNMMSDCTSIEHAMSHVTPGLFGHSITAAIACILLSIFDWRMSLALFAPLPISLGLIFLSRSLQARLGERHVQAKLNVSDQVQEYLEGIKVVKAFGLDKEKSTALKESFAAMKKEAIVFEGYAGVFITLAMTMLNAGIGLVIFSGVSLLSQGSLDAIRFLMFVLISAKIYSPLIVVLTLLPEFFYNLISTRRMQSLRHEPVMGGDPEASISSYGIAFDNVSFAYGKEEVIKSLTLNIPQNGLTALVGPSGSGKTTVSRLIARFWDVGQGSILIGGKDLREIDPEKLMS